jgi:heterodisulfide reductase subunit A
MSENTYKIGVYICECGPNIANAVDIDRVVETVSKYPDIYVVKRHKLLCSGPGKDFLHEDIIAEGLTHVVVAACSPKDHETTFANICKKSGLNPYLYQLINIREQCAWMIKDQEAATNKVISYIRSGVRRVKYHSSLEQKELESTPDVLVIGGGIAGIESALNLASNERKVYLVEKSGQLGGVAGQFEGVLSCGGLSPEVIRSKIESVKTNLNIRLFYDSEVENIIGFFGNFEVTVRCPKDEKVEIKVGSVVISTGFELFNPTNCDKYGIVSGTHVMLIEEVESKAKTGLVTLKDGSAPKSIALVHCTGRDEVGYCSGVCCNRLFAVAEYFKSNYPEIEIFDVYRNLPKTSPEDAAQISLLQEKGVVFIRANDASIEGQFGKTVVKYKTEKGIEKTIDVDLAVIAPAIIPGGDTQKIAQMLDICIDKFGFFEEEHSLTGSFKTSVDGVFVVGCAIGPKGIIDSATQALAASGNILSRLIPGKKIHPEVKTSEVIEALCTGCQTCVAVCSYGATNYDVIRRVSVVNEAICRGCGNCAGSCPSGAIRAKHFTEKQLHQEVIEAISASNKVNQE